MAKDISSLSETRAATLRPLLETAEQDLLVRGSRRVVGDVVKAIMIGYRITDLSDPEAWQQQAVTALEDYPVIVLARLSNPKVGIVRTARYCPSIAEMVSWCEADLDAMRRAMGLAALQVDRDTRASARTQEAMDRATQRAAETRAAAQRAAQAQQMAVRAGRGAAMHESAEVIRNRARQAWMTAVFKATVDAGQPDLAYGLTQEQQDEATAREMQQPGAGCWYLMQILGVEKEA